MSPRLARRWSRQPNRTMLDIPKEVPDTALDANLLCMSQTRMNWMETQVRHGVYSHFTRLTVASVTDVFAC